MRRTAPALALLLLAVSCGGGSGLATATVVLEGDRGTTRVDAEVADSDDERRQGLKGREELADDAGMVFVYDEPTTTRFVMEDTLIPLSIAFADAEGRIVTIRDMEPCREEPCPTYASDAPYLTALEVNQGALDRWGIGVGDRLRLEDDPG